MRNELLGYCIHCNSPVFYNEDEDRVMWPDEGCDCEIVPAQLDDTIRKNRREDD